MTGKDVLTLLLCTFGYDRNIQITIERLGYDEPCYDVHAENADGDVYSECDSEGLMFHIFSIISYMTHHNRYLNAPSEKTRYLDLHELNFDRKWWEIPPKNILDKKKREEIIAGYDEREKGLETIWKP